MSQKTHFVTIAKTNLFMPFGEVGLTSVYSENYAKHIDIRCGRRVGDSLTAKEMVYAVTSLL
jgi:hypothetical protein